MRSRATAGSYEEPDSRLQSRGLLSYVGGNFYALDSSTGQKLWGQVLGGGGGIGGGIITYTVNGAQKIAVADDFTMVAWPTKPVSAKVIILGLDRATTGP